MEAYKTERMNLRLSRAERDALEALARARATTRTAVLRDLLLAAAPRERVASTMVDLDRPGRPSGRAVEVTA